VRGEGRDVFVAQRIVAAQMDERRSTARSSRAARRAQREVALIVGDPSRRGAVRTNDSSAESSSCFPRDSAGPVRRRAAARR
jgi:hypothetical protein